MLRKKFQVAITNNSAIKKIPKSCFNFVQSYISEYALSSTKMVSTILFQYLARNGVLQQCYEFGIQIVGNAQSQIYRMESFQLKELFFQLFSSILITLLPQKSEAILYSELLMITSIMLIKGRAFNNSKL